jgi:hypothetical protein
MRRYALLATALLLAGCSGSGYWSYMGDTITLPGANPNLPAGNSENYNRVRAKMQADAPPLLPEAGDVWPGPPRAEPTLADVEKQQNQMMNGPAGSLPPDMLPPEFPKGPLQPLPEIPGTPITPPPPPGAPPGQSFPGGVVNLPNGQGVETGGTRAFKTFNGPGGNGSIVVPNGNGTSTVIHSDGSIETIPTPR